MPGELSAEPGAGVPAPVYLRWKGFENAAEGDLYVRSGPGTVRLDAADTAEYVATRFGPP